MNIGKKIKKVRELRNLSQEHLADVLKTTQSYYSKMERGVVDIPFSKVIEIATALGVQVEELIGFNENLIFNLKNNKRANGLVINQMSNDQKKLYDDFVEALKAENTYLKSTIDKLINKSTKK